MQDPSILPIAACDPTPPPAFFRSKTVARLSSGARLLFVAAWTLADDEGRVRWNAAHLRGFAFRYDDDVDALVVAQWMADIVDLNLIEPYEANGSTYAVICGFSDNNPTEGN